MRCQARDAASGSAPSGCAPPPRHWPQRIIGPITEHTNPLIAALLAHFSFLLAARRRNCSSASPWLAIPSPRMLRHRVIAAIPARFASERLPGKPLREINGVPMILHVVRAAKRANTIDQVIVATDHEGIASLVRADGEGAIAVMTDSGLASGTDRIEAAVRALGFEADIIVNVQGDEPLIQPSAINLVARLLQDCDRADMSTLAAPLPPSALLDINKVKLVCREVLTSGNEQLSPRQLMALYFSRAPIGVERSALQQALRESARGDDSAGAVAAATEHACELHVGVYGYRASTLRRFVQLPPSRLERLEKLEQMRAVEAGMHIAVGRIQCAPHNVDTEEDLLAVSSILKAEASGTPLSRDQPRRYPVLS